LIYSSFWFWLSVSVPEYSEYFCIALTQSNLKRYIALFLFEGIFKESKIRLIHYHGSIKFVVPEMSNVTSDLLCNTFLEKFSFF